MPDLEGFYRDLLDHLSDGVYFTDAERRITYWNKAAEQLTGYSKEEVLGRSCKDNILMHVDETGKLLCLAGCPLAQSMEDRQPREQEVYLRTKEGHRLPVLVKASPIIGPGGEVKGAVEIFSSNSAKTQILERLAEMERNALIDALTGISNRRNMEMHLQSRLEEFSRHRWTFGILFIDIDHFKSINDRYGHSIGDKVLRMVGQTLNASSRYFDQVGRWGGEEFLAIIVNVGMDRLAEIAERFRILVERSALPQQEQEGEVAVTISLGGTEVRQGDTVDSIVERADQKLYLAKQSGRNRVCL
jgi:diguanylate cyclase (GGDEF)-like protein/PAS domain S-box-containing protein